MILQSFFLITKIWRVIVATGMLQNLQEKWMDGKVGRARRENDENFQHNGVSQRKVKKEWGGGFLLYL